MIRLIPVAEVDTVWPYIAEGMDEACRKARSNFSSVDFYRACRLGTAFLVIVVQPDGGGWKGAAVLEIHEREEGRTLKVAALCGEDAEDWLPSLIKWEWVRTMQIRRVVAEGRPGLARRMQKFAPSLKIVRQAFEWEIDDA